MKLIAASLRGHINDYGVRDNYRKVRMLPYAGKLHVRFCGGAVDNPFTFIKLKGVSRLSTRLMDMKISSKGRYALRMMIDIAENSRGGWVTIKDISERQGISTKYLEQIVTHLTRGGLLRSGRGPQGGYRLTKAPEQYTAGQILRAIEGKLAPVACLEDEQNQCDRYELCPTIRFWEGLYDTITQYVESVTLRELIKEKPEEDGWGYSI